MYISAFEIPTALYFLAPILAVSNFYYRKFDLALNRGTFAPNFVASDTPMLDQIIMKKGKVGLLANIYSTLHVSCYIYFFVKYNLMSVFILSITSLIVASVFIKIEDILFKSQSDFMSIYRVSKLAQFVSPITVAMMFFVLFIGGAQETN